MATEIIMPKAGMTMEEGILIRWLKEVGDPVQSGEGIMEIETDKTTMENEAPADGVLLAKLYDDGAVVPVTTILGYIGNPGEKAPEVPATVSAATALVTPSHTHTPAEQAAPTTTASHSKTLATPYAKTLAVQNGIALGTVTGSGTGGVIKARDVLKATPLAARIAADRGIDLASVAGTGFGGKITSADLPAVSAADIETPLAGMRKVIAQRMLQSHLEIPPVTQTMKAHMDELHTLRAKMNEAREQKITINDFIVMACARAVAEYPRIRTEIDMQAGRLITREYVNIGIAVALEEGLIVPVIKDADKLTLSQISAQARELVARARGGMLCPDAYSGSTFTISNLGAAGIFTFTPIINQPNAAIMGIGSIHDELALIGGQVVPRKYLMLCLTFDHRVVDGALAAAFQRRVKALLEHPLEMLV